MLETLHITNYALIDETTIDFTEGLNILTGETGAGKSILIGALSLALGQRASEAAFRREGEKIVCEACFDVSPQSDAAGILERLGIDAEEGQVILRREIASNGKSSCRINGMMATVSSIREVGSALVDIYGQNEGQKLLDPKTHLSYLDGFCEKEASGLKAGVKEAYGRLRSAEKALAQAEERARHAEEEKRRAQEALAEIDPLKLAPGEEESLEKKIRSLANRQRLLESAQEASRLLYYSDRGASSLVADALASLEKAAALDEELKPALSLIESVGIEIEEAALLLRDYIGSLPSDEGRLEEMQAKLAKIRALTRKYADTSDGLIEYAENARKTLQAINRLPEAVKEAQQERNSAEEEYFNAASALSASRKAYGRVLEEKLSAALAELAMEKASFAISFSERQAPSELGIDEVEFLFSANPGMPARPLAKIASGGELSRIMLAFKSIYAANEEPTCMIFDEIDTGISGRAAQLVAEKMARLAMKRQILAITHLPQIAAMADAHYLISKNSSEADTTASIQLLEAQGRRQELARMGSGAKVTDATLESAADILAMADSYKAGMREERLVSNEKD